MKKELLECLIRECVKELLETFPQMYEADDTAGAPAPPAGGQGTADAPPTDPTQTPAQDPNQAPPTTTVPRGVWYVDPRRAAQPTYKGDSIKTLAGKDQAQIERELYKVASKSGGPRLKVASSTLREVPKVLAGQVPAAFLYIGKQDPEDSDEEIYLLPAKTLEQAKQSSVPPGTSAQHPTTAIATSPPGYTVPQSGPEAANKTIAPDIDEASKLREMLVGMVRETLNETRK